jgi:nucleoside-diphosphate-sugar epimerase
MGEPAPAGYQRAQLTEPAFVASLLGGIHAIVHLEPLALAQRAGNDASGDALDLAARGTHVLLKAASEAGVLLAVQASTLDLMDAYDDGLDVTEQWRPRPRPTPGDLAPYVAELTAREFTRDERLSRPLSIVCLRFGAIGAGHGNAVVADPRAVHVRDAAQAVVLALGALERGTRQRGHRWLLYHIAAPHERARYSSDLARRELGYGRPEEGQM